MNRLAITKITRKNKTYTAYIALDERRDFIDFELYPEEEEHLLGCIYIGRVESVLSNISAAFVRIAPEQTCFLPLSEVPYAFFTKKQSEKKAICAGDELLVQIVKEAVKTKDPVVSAKLTLNGSYAVLTTQSTNLSASKKLPEELRLQQRQLLEETCEDHLALDYGIITRTNSAQAAASELREDVSKLAGSYRLMRERSIHLAAFTCVYQPIPAYIRRLQAVRDFSAKPAEVHCGLTEATSDNCAPNPVPSYDGIYTDIPKIRDEITAHLPYLSDQKLLHFYDDNRVSLSTLYNIEGNIDKLLSKQIWLKSGANIIIEQLETLTFIDVNSAKNIKAAKNPKKADDLRRGQILLVNKEAAAEAARALRLRNISGMIIIDFINMEDARAEEELVSFIKKELKKDVVPCRFVDITKLGLVEITRKKVNRSLKEIVSDLSFSIDDSTKLH